MREFVGVVLAASLTLSGIAQARTADGPSIWIAWPGDEADAHRGSLSTQHDLRASDALMIPWVLRLDEAQSVALRDLFDAYRLRRARAAEQHSAFERRLKIDSGANADPDATEKAIQEGRDRLSNFAETARRDFEAQVFEILTPEQQANWPRVERFITRSGHARFDQRYNAPGQLADPYKILWSVLGGSRPSDEVLDALDRYSLDANVAVSALLERAPEGRTFRDWQRLQLGLGKVNIQHGPRIAALLADPERQKFTDRYLTLAAFDGCTLRNGLLDIEIVIEKVGEATEGSPQSAAFRALVAEFRADIRSMREQFLAERVREFEWRLDHAPPDEYVMRRVEDFHAIGREELRRASQLVASFRESLKPEQLECLSPALREEKVEPPVFE